MSQRHSAAGCIGAQFVVISNAGNEDSELLNHLQELGHEAVRNKNDSRVWLEWSMEPGADPVDQKTWSDTMPTLNQPNGISLDYIREECETMKMDDFMREYLCVRIPKSESALFDFDRWKELRRDDVFVVGDLVIAIDVTPDRQRASIVVGSRNGTYIPVEVIESREGVEWLVDRTAEIAERHSAAVVVDTGGPAAAMHMILEQRGIEVIPFAAKDVANSAACFYDRVRDGTVAHLNQYALNDAVRAARKRPIGERWAYARRGNVDISPLVAASFAVWAIDSGNIDKPTIHV
jgi:phage terminase large subunit-like protein